MIARPSNASLAAVALMLACLGVGIAYVLQKPPAAAQPFSASRAEDGRFPAGMEISSPPGPNSSDPSQRSQAVAGAQAPPLVWGVNGHPFSAYPISYGQQLDLVARLGAKYYRVNLQNNASADEFDKLLTLAEKKGVEVLPILFPDAAIDKDTPEYIYRQAYDVGQRMSKRFKGRIKVWELGNEFENHAIIKACEMRDDGTQYPCDWGPAGGVEAHEYFGPRWKQVSAALDGLSDGVKSGDPSARRAMGTAGWGHTGAFDRLKADGVEWEISVWHQYSEASGNEWAYQRLAKFGKPIWITEFGHPGGSGEGNTPEGEAKQGAGYTAIMSGINSMRGKYRIEAAFSYELLDEPYWSGQESVMGLVRLDRAGGDSWKVGRDKPAFDAMKAAMAP